MDGTGRQAHRTKRRGNVVPSKHHVTEAEEELSTVDWRTHLRQTFRQQANDRHHRIRGHFYAGFPNANLHCCALRPKVNIPASGASPTFSSSLRPCYALAYGWPGTDLLPLPPKFIGASNRPERGSHLTTPAAPPASKTPRRLRSRLSIPIAALVWTVFPNIPRAGQGKSAPCGSAP